MHAICTVPEPLSTMARIITQEMILRTSQFWARRDQFRGLRLQLLYLRQPRPRLVSRSSL